MHCDNKLITVFSILYPSYHPMSCSVKQMVGIFIVYLTSEVFVIKKCVNQLAEKPQENNSGSSCERDNALLFRK